MNIGPEIIQELSRGASKVLSPRAGEKLYVKAEEASGCVYNHSNCDAVYCISFQAVSPVGSGDCARGPRVGSAAGAVRELAGASPGVLGAWFSWQQVFTGVMQVLRNLYELLFRAYRKVQHRE